MKITEAQRAYLELAKDQPGGKLPIYDGEGKRVNPRTIQACMTRGLCVSWYRNPIEPGWPVCKITLTGKKVMGWSQR